MNSRIINKRMNSMHFLSLRLLGALFVLFAHSFVLSGKLPYDLLAVFPAIGGIAALGVTLFFIISGYLITQSWTRQPSLLPFLRKRFLRVFPGLLGCLVFSVVVGSVFTTLPASAFWVNKELPIYLARNLLLQNYLPLPGVFIGNPESALVNGSLWTIPIEVTCYLVVLLLGLTTLFQKPRLSIAALGAILALAVTRGEQLNLFGATIVAPALPGYYAAFVLGALNYQARDWLPRSLPFSALLLILAWLAPNNAATYFLCVGALSYFVINLARVLGGRFAEKRGALDLSYGIYLYAFPIQQALVQSFPAANGWMILGMTLPLCLACAYLSWHFIEQPCLRLKGGGSSPQ